MDDDFIATDNEILVALLVEEDEITLDVFDVQGQTLHIEEIHTEVTASFHPENDEDTFLESDVVVDTFQERRQQKFRAQSRSKKQWLGLTALVLAGLLTLVIVVLESPFYDVDKVAITNTSNVALTEAEKKKIESFTKRLRGQAMYQVDYGSVVDDVASLPTISKVSIDKTWPNKVVVTITRRSPVAFIETNKGKILIDKDGFAYEKVETAPAGLPSLDGIKEVTFTHKISDATYLSILQAAPAEIVTQISRINKEKESYLVVLSDGITIVLGNKSNLKEKLAISWSILNAKKRSELGYIDVSVPSLPVSGSPKLKV